MIFSGSRHYYNPRTADELGHIVDQCIEQSHRRLVDSDDLVADVRRTLSRNPLMPWGTRLDVQGQVRPSSCEDDEPGKASELSTARRSSGPWPSRSAPRSWGSPSSAPAPGRPPRPGPTTRSWRGLGSGHSSRTWSSTVGFTGAGARSYWIGILRHDETPYITGRISWLVGHIAGRGRIRHLLHARRTPSGTGTKWRGLTR
mmetsp:Transcript_39880/g.112702  ORF Transcript_39880/g.112702 Transcript_39880/m.112702 type:complete len:201 (-) Transcript_39880:127-729(-)